MPSILIVCNDVLCGVNAYKGRDHKAIKQLAAWCLWRLLVYRVLYAGFGECCDKPDGARECAMQRYAQFMYCMRMLLVLAHEQVLAMTSWSPSNMTPSHCGLYKSSVHGTSG
eukprot:1140643-Pelagomonas_calceolata.AAC.4